MHYHRPDKKFNTEFIKQLLFSMLGLFVFAMIAFPLVQKFSKQRELNKEINELKKEKSYSVDRGQELSQVLEYLNSDEFIDEQARQNLNYKKNGEEVVVIDGGPDMASSTAKYKSSRVYEVDLSEKVRKRSNPAKWFAYFFIDSRKIKSNAR